MLPSPVVHVTEVGVAVAATDAPGVDADADTGFHWSIHNHVGRFTN
ncbi:hypothetical protein GCM10022243_32410 [Saccharothrix violaceirubra]